MEVTFHKLENMLGKGTHPSKLGEDKCLSKRYLPEPPGGEDALIDGCGLSIENKKQFEKDSVVEAVFLIDAANTFNWLN